MEQLNIWKQTIIKSVPILRSIQYQWYCYPASGMALSEKWINLSAGQKWVVYDSLAINQYNACKYWNVNFLPLQTGYPEYHRSVWATSQVLLYSPLDHQNSIKYLNIYLKQSIDWHTLSHFRKHKPLKVQARLHELIWVWNYQWRESSRQRDIS